MFLSFCLFVFLYFLSDITPIKCMKGLKCQKSLFVSKLHVAVSDPVTKVRYRAARAAKNCNHCGTIDPKSSIQVAKKIKETLGGTTGS